MYIYISYSNTIIFKKETKIQEKVQTNICIRIYFILEYDNSIFQFLKIFKKRNKNTSSNTNICIYIYIIFYHTIIHIYMIYHLLSYIYIYIILEYDNSIFQFLKKKWKYKKKFKHKYIYFILEYDNSIFQFLKKKQKYKFETQIYAYI